MSSIARFDTWQAADGTNVARYNAGTLEVWDGAAWVEPSAGSGVVATGGTVSTITIAGVECNLHTFTSSGTFTVTSAGTIDYLMIAGGGSGGLRTGGNGGGGGGGSGGLLSGSVAVTPGDYTITVGAGGAPRTGSDGSGNPGTNTVAFGQTCVGGGYGASGANPGGNGGSGGGAGSNSAAGGGGSSSFGTGTANQGYDGGFTDGANQAAGGGGPAGGGGSRQPENHSPGGGFDASYFLGQSNRTTVIGGGGTGHDGAVARDAYTAGGKTAGADGVRGGGGAGRISGSASGAGGDGIVYIRYAI